MDVLEMRGDHLMEIKAAALKSLTSIIHLDRNPNFPKLNTIIDVTGGRLLPRLPARHGQELHRLAHRRRKQQQGVR